MARRLSWSVRDRPVRYGAELLSTQITGKVGAPAVPVIDADARARAGISRHRLESLETQREPVAIQTVLDAARKMDGSAVQSFQGFEHWAIFLYE
jgi:hypothetical protein